MSRSTGMRNWGGVVTWRGEEVLSEKKHRIGQKMGIDTDSERSGGLEIRAVPII